MEPHQAPDDSRRTFLKDLRTYLITGLLVAAPVGITWWVVSYIFQKVDGLLREPMNNFFRNYLKGYIPQQWWILDFEDSTIYGLGAIGVIFILLALGALARNVVGRQIITIFQRILLRVPLVSWVYNAAQQVFEVALTRKQGLLQRPVLVEFPRRGIWSIAFVTGGANLTEIQEATGSNSLLFMFIPTTPNPTSGWLIAVPEEDTHPLNMSVDAAIKMVISGGVVMPPGRKPDERDVSQPSGAGQVREESPTT